jgi:hypothetical protein
VSKLNFPERLALVESLGFKHGVAFVLAEEVPNPTPDRRHTYDWRKLANIPAGKRFRVIEESHDHSVFDNLDTETRTKLVQDMEKKRRFVLEPCNDPYAFSHRIRLWSDSDAPLWDVIVPNLVPDARTFDDVLWRADDVAHLDAKQLLEALIACKRLTFADLDTLIDELHLDMVRKEQAS